MKGKIITGRGLSGLSRYVNKHKRDAEHIAGSCDPRDFLRTAAALRATRPDVRQAAIHISISMPPGQPLTPEQWDRAGEILRREMNLDGCEFQLVRHHDTEHDHCHLIACKIKSDGSLWNDSHSARRLHKACEQIEREMNLQQTLTVEQHRRQRAEGTASKPMSDGALRQFQRTGDLPKSTKQRIAERKRNELEAADRAAHLKADRDSGQLAEGRARDPGPNPQPGKADRSTEKADRSANPTTARTGNSPARPIQPVQVAPAAPAAARPAANAAEKEHDMIAFWKKKPTQADQPAPQQQPAAAPEVQGSIASSLPVAVAPTIDPSTPPTLKGRLMPVRCTAGHFDLFWKDRTDGKPSFRWQPEGQRRLLILAQPSEKNVAALFDAAAEKNIGMPQITITGTPEFQRLAALEAAKRGLPVDTSKLDEAARDLYQQAWNHHHGDAANSIASAAYESADREEQRRIAEAEKQRQQQGNDEAVEYEDDRDLDGQPRGPRG